MRYKRTDQVFSIASLMTQLSAHIQETGRLPRTIYLPPEEYVFINYLLNPDYTDGFTQHCQTFLSIPLMFYTDPQDYPFKY